MDTDAFLDRLQQSANYSHQIVHVERVPAREARYGGPREPVSEAGARMLADMGIVSLFSHQAQALDLVRQGRNVLTVTGTASGKTLCYLLPIFELIERDPSAKVVALYPTKALSQDQLRVFQRGRDAAGLETLNVGVFDGDTPSAQRRRIRDEANVVITNPDMLHAGILAQHARWAPLFTHLRYVVVDEMHTYAGLFGSNAAHLFRRLLRVCRHYGSKPQFIASSATIGNPLNLAQRLTGEAFALVDDDGSPRGARTYVMWNPPKVLKRRRRTRRSANVEAHELMAELLKLGAPTITFSKAKVTSELIHRYVREKLQKEAPELAGKITPYRGGYLPEERREIEKRLFNGELMGVSATRALELGIDVGALEACIIVGYPGTLASFFQQAGRAGRRDKEAVVFLVGVDTAINQYVMQHPDYVFGRPIEEAVIDPDNAYVLVGQLRCAAHELPLQDDEVGDYGPWAHLVLDVLENEEKVLHRDGTWYHASPETPQHEVSLRDYADRNVVIMDSSDNGRVIGQVNKFDAQPILHPGAIYLHQGETYHVDLLDLEENICRVRKVDVDYYTQPLGGTDVHHVDQPLRERPFGTGRAVFGEVTAYFRNEMYERINFYTLDAISVHQLDMPNFALDTMAFWLVPDVELCNQLWADGYDTHSGLRGIGYATRMVLPLLVKCETLDFSHTIGAANAPWQTIFIYERYPLGLGFTEHAYDRLHELMPRVLDHMEQCDCDDGCPCCVGKPLRQYTTWNIERGEGHIPSKVAAIRILKEMLGDGARLQEPDTTSRGQQDKEARLSLERGVRRRLERMREPKMFHPVEHDLKTEYPKLEARTSLDQADVARRAARRKLFRAALRGVKQTETEEAKEPLTAKRLRLAREALRAQPPTESSHRRGAEPERSAERMPAQDAVVMGDSLASRARKRRRRSNRGSEST